MSLPDTGLLVAVGAGLVWLLAQERRIQELKDRVREIGQTLRALPKRKGD
jgi:hypothetical protein